MSKTPASSSATRTGESSPALAVQTSAYASADGVLGPLIVSGVSVPFAVAVHPQAPSPSHPVLLSRFVDL